MNPMRRPARINYKVLAIIVGAVVVLGVGGAVGYKIRKRVTANRALAEGTAALDRSDYAEAAKKLKQYLSKYPDNIDVLFKYARANLSVRPLEIESIGASIGAYRRVLRFRPDDEAVYVKLASLYRNIRNYVELAYVARMRLDHVPGDPEASIWLAEALVSLRTYDEATEILKDLIDRLGKQSEKRSEYVKACEYLSAIAMQGKGGGGVRGAAEWLDRAVAYDAGSAEALVTRARFRRVTLPITAKDRREAISAALADLAKADSLKPTDPRVRLLLCDEWMKHGRLDKAEAELDAVKDIDEQAIEKDFLDPDDWIMAKFTRQASLSIRKGTGQEGVELAGRTLERLTLKRHRIPLLPTIVRLYVAGKKLKEARRYLDEYIEALRVTKALEESNEKTAVLKAVVARVEGRHYLVVEMLEPLAVRNPRNPMLWRLLAEAYAVTGQLRRAAEALQRYLGLRSTDVQMAARLVRTYFDQQDWRGAHLTARKVLEQVPDNLAVNLMGIEAGIQLASSQAREKGKKADYKVQKEKLAKLRKAHPKLTTIRILQAMITSNEGRAEDSRRELELAAKECDDRLLAELQLARIHLSSGRAAEAIKLCQAAAKREPEAVAPRHLLAELYVADKKHDEARKVLREALAATSQPSSRKESEVKLAFVDLLYGDRKAGVKSLESLAVKYPHELHLRSMLLRLPEVLDDQAKAQKLVDEIRLIEGQTGLAWRLHQAGVWLYDKNWRAKSHDIAGLLGHCIDQDEKWVAPVLVLGRMHERLGHADQAETTYRRALTSDSDAVAVADRLVALLERQKRYSEAKRVLDSFGRTSRPLRRRRLSTAIGVGDLDEATRELRLQIANDPKDVNARVLLARLLFGKNRDAAASLDILDEAARIAPDSMAVTTARVAILNDSGQPDKAKKVLDDEVARKKSFQAYLMRGTYLANIGETKLAEKDLDKLTTFSDRSEQGYEVLGEFYRDCDRIDDAIATWIKGSKAHVESVEIRRRLMKALLARGKNDDKERGIALLETLQKARADDPDLMWVEALVLADKGTDEEIRKSEAVLERLVRREPTAVDAHLRLISIAFDRRDYSTARERVIKAQSANPNNTKLLMARAEMENALKNPSMARELANMVLKQNPENGDARDILIKTALGTRDPKALRDTLSFVDGIIEKEPDNNKVRVAQAMLLNATGQRDKAIEKLEAYAKTEKGRRGVEVLLALGMFYEARGDSTKARREIELAEKISPKSRSVMRARLVWLRNQKQYNEIDKLIADWPTTQPMDAETVAQAAASLAGSGDPKYRDKAMALFRRAVKAAPYLVGPQLGLAVLAYQKGDIDLAEKTYRSVLDRDPHNVQALNDLAWTLAEAKKDFGAALELANRGIKLAPENAHLRDTRGVVLMNFPDRLKEARDDFLKAVELAGVAGPVRAKAMLRLGRVYMKLEDSRSAKEVIEKALKIDRAQGVFNEQERREMNAILGK